MSMSDIKIENYYLDLNKVEKINSASERNVIHNYYRDMLNISQDSVLKPQMMSYFNTLYIGGFLLNIRSSKLKEILE